MGSVFSVAINDAIQDVISNVTCSGKAKLLEVVIQLLNGLDDELYKSINTSTKSFCSNKNEPKTELGLVKTNLWEEFRSK
jgi:hypothetical protein